MIPADRWAGLGPATIIRGDALNLPIPDGSVDLIVTSPPYFALRSYQDGGEHYEGQIGSEPTPDGFVTSLLDATREMIRVTKPTGSIWVNLGDKYNSASGPGGTRIACTDEQKRGAKWDERDPEARGKGVRGIKPKSLIGVPWRYALRCIDDLGLILRAEVIWSKCLSGGTVVYARTKGRVQAIRLHDLCRAYEPSDVQLWTGEKWSQVRAWEPTSRGEAQYELELRSGERIGCTPEHRWPTSRGLLRSDELTVGDVLDTCELPAGDVSPAALDDEMIGWFVGLYIAEGSRSEQTIQIAGHVDESERFKRLSELAEAFHGTCRAHATGGQAATINLTGSMLRAIIDTYVGGRTAKDKHLAPKCWQRSNAFLRAVLDGYLSGDGHYDAKANRWVLGFTDNDQLASDLRAIGARVGLSVRVRRTTHFGFGKSWPGWGGNIAEPHRRRQPDSQIVGIRPSRARQFWDVAIEDEPHLFALASGVLTHNSNGLPESVTDRVRRSHEQWFHFTLSPRYFAAVDEIREPYEAKPQRRFSPRSVDRSQRPEGQSNRTDCVQVWDTPRAGDNPLGKLPGSVWEIPTEPLNVPAHLGVDHFAAFPSEWPRRIITGWSPAGVCTACGEGRRPVVARDEIDPRHLASNSRQEHHERLSVRGVSSSSILRTGLQSGQSPATRITGYACACPDTSAPTTPATILDPFGGTGTVAMVARALGRHGISVDLSHDYCRLARWRVAESGGEYKVRGVEKPKVIDQAQASIFDALSGEAS